MSNDTPMPNRDSTRKDPNRSAEQPQEIITSVNENNTTQGSEFLDDAIRVKDQPFKYNKAKTGKKDPRSLL
jgi:hypothetical protein